MFRLALLSMHGCPVARLGERDTGGMNVYLLQLARELGRRGHKVDVYTRCHDPEDPQVVELGENARVVHLQAGPYFDKKEALHRFIPEFLGNLYRFQESEGTSYDLIHSHYWLSGMAGIEVSRRWNVPHVTTFHTTAKTKMQARAGETELALRISAESRVMGSASTVVVLTEQERADLSRLYRLNPSKVQVVPAGVDVEMFRPLDKARARQALGFRETRIVLSVGRIEPLKGLDILIAAVAELDDKADTRLLIVGGKLDGDGEVEKLRSLASDLGLEDTVTFTGAVDQTELPSYYSAADIFALPSYYESFGLVALEAMACGTPVVASRVGGPRAFLKGSENGYLIPWHCPEPYAQCLETLLSNPGLRESMGRAARETAQEMGWDAMAGKMLDLYSGVIDATWRRAAGA